MQFYKLFYILDRHQPRVLWLHPLAIHSFQALLVFLTPFEKDGGTFRERFQLRSLAFRSDAIASERILHSCGSLQDTFRCLLLLLAALSAAFGLREAWCFSES